MLVQGCQHVSAFSFSTMISPSKHQNSSKQKSYSRPKNLSENHGQSYQSFREEERYKKIQLPLINNLRQPKNICTNTHIYIEKSHIPQALRDSATSRGHRWRIKAFTVHRPACTSRGHSGRPFRQGERQPLCLAGDRAAASARF